MNWWTAHRIFLMCIFVSYGLKVCPAGSIHSLCRTACLKKCAYVLFGMDCTPR